MIGVYLRIMGIGENRVIPMTRACQEIRGVRPNMDHPHDLSRIKNHGDSAKCGLSP